MSGPSKGLFECVGLSSASFTRRAGFFKCPADSVCFVHPACGPGRAADLPAAAMLPVSQSVGGKSGGIWARADHIPWYNQSPASVFDLVKKA